MKANLRNLYGCIKFFYNRYEEFILRLIKGKTVTILNQNVERKVSLKRNAGYIFENSVFIHK